ncbi:MAG: hypothetical protein QXT63_01255 [Thermoplasmata archaeon]
MSYMANHLIHGKVRTIEAKDEIIVEGPVFIVESTHEQFYEKATRNLCPCEITYEEKVKKIEKFGGDDPYELMLIISYSELDKKIKVRLEDWSYLLYAKSKKCTSEFLTIFLECAKYCDAMGGICGVYDDDRLEDITLYFCDVKESPAKLRSMLLEFIDDPVEGRWKECVSEIVNKYDARELFEEFIKRVDRYWEEDGKAYVQFDEKMRTHRYRRIAESMVYSEIKKDKIKVR